MFSSVIKIHYVSRQTQAKMKPGNISIVPNYCQISVNILTFITTFEVSEIGSNNH